MATKKSLLSCEEVCAIIKACTDARVATLKFGELEISFHQQVEPLEFIPKGWQPLQTTNPDAEISDEQRKHLEETSFVRDEIRAKEEILDQMLIEDPSEFEALVAQGDLEDEGGSGSVDDAEAGRS